jgi:hypothetical protein
MDFGSRGVAGHAVEFAEEDFAFVHVRRERGGVQETFGLRRE